MSFLLRFLPTVWRSLSRDERGNIAILFGACVIPVLLVMGGAVDLVRYARYKDDLSNVVDAAALALARQGADYTEAQAKTFITNYVNGMQVGDSQFTLQGFNVTKTENGFIVGALGAMKTMFLPVGKLTQSGGAVMNMDMNIVSEVVHATNRLEVALVIDNTGSMNCGATVSSSCTGNWNNPSSSSRIKSVKSAANTLVDTLMKSDLDDPDQIKIALVPFEGQVNVASAGFSVTAPPSWVEWANQGSATYDGINFDNYNFGGSIGTQRVGHKWLWSKLTANDSKVKWAGCVEMRAGDYELSDAAPDTSISDSLYVPFFWPDEPDSNNNNGGSYQNNYLNDQGTFTTGGGWNKKEDPAGAQRSLTKYTTISWQSGKKDTDGTTSPYESGPNMGCPKPILPLTNATGKTTVKTAIDGMIAYPATGTFIPTGLVWGWHVLSPGLPYTQGIGPSDPNYDRTVKAIVLFTDGENSVTGTNNHNKSIFNGYNYVSQGRLGTTNNADTATETLDSRTATLCENVKNDHVRLYTITFGTISTSTETLMKNCATLDEGERLYYHAPSTSDLKDIFDAIGKDLSNIHLAM